MATTTNYSWTTPDDTALVKDGAAAIRSLGAAIDTTVFNNASAAIAKTIVDAKGDIIAATAADTVARLAVGTDGQVLKANSATATGLEWATDASGMTNPMTTTGDTIYSSSGSTPARLGIGTAGQVLTVNSGATAPEWATVSSGGMTLISTTTLSGASTSVSSIPATYVDLYVIVKNFDPASDGASLNMKFNSHTTYDFQTAFTGTANFGSTAIPTTGSQDNGTSNALTTILIPNYAGTTWKIADCLTIGNQETTPANYQFYRAAGLANLTSAISSLVFSCSSGNFSGGTVLVYGVK